MPWFLVPPGQLLSWYCLWAMWVFFIWNELQPPATLQCRGYGVKCKYVLCLFRKNQHDKHWGLLPIQWWVGLLRQDIIRPWLVKHIISNTTLWWLLSRPMFISSRHVRRQLQESRAWIFNYIPQYSVHISFTPKCLAWLLTHCSWFVGSCFYSR